MREAEGSLFGHAWLKGPDGKPWASRSTVTLRLDSWEPRPLDEWPQGQPVRHPEVGRNVGAHLYLGYGPLTYQRGQGTRLKTAREIAPGSTRLRIAVRTAAPPCHLDDVLLLWSWFGAIGGRCRNGWGSMTVDGVEARDVGALRRYSRPMSECLADEWPRAIGTDTRGLLLWRSRETFHDWSAAMKALAELKVEIRTSLPFAAPGNGVQDRHFLASPVTHHGAPWDGGDYRLSNQLCFKVRRDADGLRGVALHLPHGLPTALIDEVQPAVPRAAFTERQARVWGIVHGILDRSPLMERWPA
jgi:CRISPR-associated protein Cmr1